jgi:hypothetical protein
MGYFFVMSPKQCFFPWSFWQNLASKDQSRLSEPVQELDIWLTQVVFVILTNN